jgi:hypothetical protein
MLDVKRASTRRLVALALALGASALGASAPALAQESGQIDRGFTIMGTFGGRMATVATGGGGGGGNQPSVYGSGLLTGLFLGYKAGRVLIGAGLEFSNDTHNTTQCRGGTGVCGSATNPELSVTTSNSNFLIGPDFEFAIVRSADQRVELIGDAAIHFGHAFATATTTVTPSPPPPPAGPSGPTESNFLLSYRIAPGVRFWAHRHFAIQAVTGFGGQAYFDLPVPNVPANGNNSQHGIFATFGALGTF